MNSLGGLKSLRIHKHSNITFLYLNINSIKIDNLKLIINENVDILCISETKTEGSFPTAQFLLPRYHQTRRTINLYKSPFDL